MSLSHSKYLKTLDSERRVAAVFPTVQQQLDRMREDIRLLFDMVEKLTYLYEKEHGIIYDPVTAEIIASRRPTNNNNQTRQAQRS